jgi:adenine-specific DNA-methyltransferase
LQEEEESVDDETAAEEELGLQVMPSVMYKQSQVAVRYLRQLLGEKGFDNPKDHLILSRLFSYCTGPDDVILDSFAGSGSAGQAVLEPNKNDGGRRRFVLVQQPHDTNQDRDQNRNICETITRCRLCKSAKVEGYNLSFTYARVGEPLFTEYRDFGKKLPSFEDVAKYVFYTETSREIDLKKVDAESGFIGATEAAGGTSYYLLYTPNDKAEREMSTSTLKALAKKDNRKNWVIYTERIWIHQDELRRFEQEHGRHVRPMLVPFNLK